MSTTPPTQTAAHTVLDDHTHPNGHRGNGHANGHDHHEDRSNGDTHHNRFHDLTISASPPSSRKQMPEPLPPDQEPSRANASGSAASSSILPPSSVPSPLLLRFFLDGSMTLLDVCEHAEISLPDLYAWASSPQAQEQFDMIRKLSALRDELIQAEAVPQARQTLVHLATIAQPAESAASRECRRKSANTLLKQCADAPSPSRKKPAEPPTTDEPGPPPPRGIRGRVSAARDDAAHPASNAPPSPGKKTADPPTPHDAHPTDSLPRLKTQDSRLKTHDSAMNPESQGVRRVNSVTAPTNGPELPAGALVPAGRS